MKQVLILFLVEFAVGSFQKFHQQFYDSGIFDKANSDVAGSEPGFQAQLLRLQLNLIEKLENEQNAPVKGSESEKAYLLVKKYSWPFFVENQLRRKTFMSEKLSAKNFRRKIPRRFYFLGFQRKTFRQGEFSVPIIRHDD